MIESKGKEKKKNGMPTSVDWVIEAARNDPKQRMEVNSSPKVFSNLYRHNDINYRFFELTIENELTIEKLFLFNNHSFISEY